MKKILSFALSLLLVVCGILPVFVANTEAAEPTMLAASGRTLPGEYKDGLNFIDFVDANPTLTPPSGNTPGDYMTYNNMYGNSVGVFNGKKFAATFTVDIPGIYNFCFQNWIRSHHTWNYIQPNGTTKYPHPGTVQIDDGEEYTISANAVLAAGEPTFNGGYYFEGLSVELTAGTHTIYISGKQPNGANPYFMSAHWYMAERTGYSAEMPFDDAITVTTVDTAGTSAPATIEFSLPYSGTYSVAAKVTNKSGNAGAFSLTLNNQMFNVYEIDDVSAGDTYYYLVTKGLKLDAGDHMAMLTSMGANTPDVVELVFASTALTGIYDATNPYPNATAVSFQAQYESNVQKNEDGSYNWYSWNTSDYKPSIGKAGIWLINPDYVYTAKFTPARSGKFALAMYLAHKRSGATANTGSFDITLSAGDEVIGEYSLTEFTGKIGSQMYYDLATGIRLEAGKEYTVAVKLNGTTDSTIVDFLYDAIVLDGVSPDNKPNIGFENAEVVALYNFRNDNPMQNASGSYQYYWWNPSDFKGTLPGKYGVSFNSDYVYNSKFTATENGKYSFSVFLANNYGNTPTVSGFEITISNDDGVIGTYTVTEVTPGAVGSKINYHFADDVALEAGKTYTIGVRRTGGTASTVVEFRYAKTEDVQKAIEDANKEDVPEGDLEFPAGIMIPLPGMMGTMNQNPEVLGQPMLKPINPIPDTSAPNTDASAELVAPPQPFFDTKAPAAPNMPGQHLFVPARPFIK